MEVSEQVVREWYLNYLRSVNLDMNYLDTGYQTMLETYAEHHRKEEE